MGDADTVEEGMGAFGAFQGGDAQKEERKFDVFADGEGGEEVEKLENVTQTLASQLGEGVAVHLSQILTGDEDGTLVWAIDSTEAIKESRFATSRRTGECETLSLQDSHADIAQNGSLIVLFEDGPAFEHRDGVGHRMNPVTGSDRGNWCKDKCVKS